MGVNFVFRDPMGAYSTSFASDEDPLSDGGNWAQAANAWSQMRTISGNAVGSQGVGANSGNDFNDSYAILQGDWGADYELDAIVYRSASINGANHEVELNLRFVDSTTAVRGYEVLLNKSGAIQLFRWENSFGSFSAEYTVTSGTNSTGGDPPNGSRFKVRIVGNVITVYYSSDGSTPTQLCTYNITSESGNHWTDGNPAIGQFCRPALDGSNPANFGFQSITVTRL